MTTANLATKRFFVNKKFFLYVKNSAQVERSIELIKLFGGQIEQFLDRYVSYVLTDVPKDSWPPRGADCMLKTAVSYGVKLMSTQDLAWWCSKYVTSQSSSDDDDEMKAGVRELQPPFIKFEDTTCHYAPSIKEFTQWPEFKLIQNSHLPVGRSFFNECVNTSENTSTNQVNNEIINNNVIHRGVKRRHSAHCEICNQKISEKIEVHVLSQQHRTNTEKLNWDEVNSVIASLPGLSTLNMRRLSNLTQPNGMEHQEFLCLHKVDSVSQLFFNSNKDQKVSSHPVIF